MEPKEIPTRYTLVVLDGLTLETVARLPGLTQAQARILREQYVATGDVAYLDQD